MKLYEIKKEYDDLMEQAEYEASQNEGEISGWVAQQLDRIEDDYVEKCANVALAIKNYRAEAEAIREEERKLAHRRKTLENRVEWLYNYLTPYVTPQTTFSDPRVAISWRKSEAVSVVDQFALPEVFWITKREPAKAIIKSEIKAGNTVPGAELVERWNLQIK